MDLRFCDSFEAKLQLTTPPPHRDPQNAIFKLNNDCLLEILRYLPLWDVVNVFKADPRFRTTVEMRVTSEDLKAVSSYWNIPEFLDMFAKKATVLHIDQNIDTQFIVNKMCLFENLQELIVNRNLTQDDIRALPQNLVKLDLGLFGQPEKLAIFQWFRVLNPTLRELVLHFSNMASLTELHNLESLYNHLDKTEVEEYFYKAHEHIHNLRKFGIRLAYADDLKGLSRLTKIQSLTLDSIYFRSWDELTQMVPEGLRELIVVSPQLESWEDCEEQAVEEVTIKLKKMIPGLAVEITDPFVDEDMYVHSDECDCGENRDFYESSD